MRWKQERSGKNEMKVYPFVSKRLSLLAGDILTDLAEQSRYENNHASGATLQSILFL